MTACLLVGRRVRSALLLAPAVLLLSLLLPARPAAAHPLDVYVQASYLTITTTAVTVEIDLSPGVLVAPRVLGQLDGDGDRAVSGAEARSYLQQVVDDSQLDVDGQARPLTLTGVDVPPYLTLQAGYGTLKAFVTTAATTASAAVAAGEHEVFFRNGFGDDQAAYQVNAFVGKGAPVVLGSQHRDPTQQQVTVSYRVDATAAATATPAAQDRTRAAAGSTRLAGHLRETSPSTWTVLVALGAAVLLGALHALTPGHAKTVTAAYLVGSGGTVRDAATLGAVVTVTHTASVVIIGLVALLASQFLVPGILVPALEAASGLLVLGLGIRLLRQRWPHPARVVAPMPRQPVAAGAHDSQHAARHERPHRHGGRPHSHAVPGEGVTTRSLIAMGVSGGLVPCPEALGVLVIAVGTNRTSLGLGLIVGFSVGLAAVLIGLGVLLVRSRTLLTRLGRLPGTWTTVLPLASAVVVTVLGAGLVLRSVGAALPV